eukprot:COSAG02_NODE_6844_length_3330_cov_1.499226_2_plen_83_part_00
MRRIALPVVWVAAAVSVVSVVSVGAELPVLPVMATHGRRYWACELDALRAGERYVVRVRAETLEGWGDWSEKATISAPSVGL